MEMEFRKIAVIFKQSDHVAEKLAQTIANWLKDCGISSSIYESGAFCAVSVSDYDLAIILGGDGTILGSARRLAGTDIPFFGVNFGRVGYLTAATKFDWQEKLEQILASSDGPESALALRWQLWEGNVSCGEGIAINELVLGHGNLARLVSIKVSINEHKLGSIRSDGVMICTPTGSTGYCASAGGPALFPTLDATIFLAICPFLNSHMPLVLPAKTQYRLQPLADSPQCWLTIDGQKGFRVEAGKFITVSAWKNAIHFYGCNDRFFKHIHVRKQVENSESGKD